MSPVLPGSTLGILGSGQLGRMLALAARTMGYRTHVFSPDGEDSPAGQVCDTLTQAAYSNTEALIRFAKSVDVITLEFENIPLDSVQTLNQWVPVRPGVRALEVAQHRLREKTFLKDLGVPLARFYPVFTQEDLSQGLEYVGLPAILKTAGFGYDGKGQVKITSAEVAQTAWHSVQNTPTSDGYVLEQFIPFEKEVSVLIARRPSGETALYPVIENRHHNHILDVSFAPAQILEHTRKQALSIAHTIAKALDLSGLLCIEFFVTPEGNVLVNEIAPRPHNSGHLTIEGAITSQFEQQLRAVCDLPLGATTLHGPVAMANLLGDLWDFAPPHWDRVFSASSEAKLHLYGKHEARPGRKMGHITAVSTTPEVAVETVQQARSALCQPTGQLIGEHHG